MLSALEPKNPTRAAVYSAIIPGGGQIYNHAYVKAGVVIGVQGYLIASAIIHDNKVDEYRRKGGETNDAFYKQQYLSKQNEYQELRTSDFWWMGITMVLSVLDAYVDAHLSDFDAQKQKLHLRFEEEKLTFQYRF
jgi:hypothetical protein